MGGEMSRKLEVPRAADKAFLVPVSFDIRPPNPDFDAYRKTIAEAVKVGCHEAFLRLLLSRIAEEHSSTTRPRRLSGLESCLGHLQAALGALRSESEFEPVAKYPFRVKIGRVIREVEREIRHERFAKAVVDRLRGRTRAKGGRPPYRRLTELMAALAVYIREETRRPLWALLTDLLRPFTRTDDAESIRNRVTSVPHEESVALLDQMRQSFSRFAHE
jgi:hypothetical protein